MSCLVFFLAARFQFGHEHSVADQLFVFADNAEVVVHQAHIFPRSGDPGESILNPSGKCLDLGFFLFRKFVIFVGFVISENQGITVPDTEVMYLLLIQKCGKLRPYFAQLSAVVVLFSFF